MKIPEVCLLLEERNAFLFAASDTFDILIASHMMEASFRHENI